MAFFSNSILDAFYSSLVPPVLVAVLIYSIVNIKVVPFAWHLRVFYGYFRHYYFDKRLVPASTGDSPTLFQPTIYATSTPLGEIDYSLHKSNSTYLTDLDVARGHHVYCLFRVGAQKYSKKKGTFFPALGGVTCTFRKEIRPYDKLEIWTRVLAWDAKWIYLISHFVKANATHPSQYTDQSWRNTRTGGRRITDDDARTGEANLSNKSDSAVPASGAAPTSSVIYATCISKYVLKEGRKTVAPDEFLRACGLLPSVLETDAPPKLSEIAASAETSTTKSRFSGQQGVDHDSLSDESIYRQIEEKRQEGLVLANHLAAVDDGHKWFTGDGETVFAKY